MALVWTPHIKIAIGGRLQSAGGTTWYEAWQSTLKSIYKDAGGVEGGVAPQGFTDAACVALKSAVQTWITQTATGAQASFSVDVLLDYLKINAIDVTGKYAHPTVSQATYTAIGGPSVRGEVNWREAMVMGTRCIGYTKGRTAFARTYIPPLVAATLQSTRGPYLNATTAAGVVSRFVTLLQAINAYTSPTGEKMQLAHVSAGNDALGIPSRWSYVTQVKMNGIPGNMRSRTNKAPPIWYSGAL
jgi:hypothetical protein